MRILRQLQWLAGRLQWRRVRSLILSGKTGSGFMLLFFDVLLMIGWVLDLRQLRSYSVDYWETLSAPSVLVDLANLRLHHLLFLLLLPVIISVYINFFIYKLARGSYLKLTATPTAKGWLLVLHMGVVGLIVIHLGRVDYLTQLAGMCGGNPLVDYCFQTSFAFMERLWVLFLGMIASAAGLLFKDVILRNRELLREFNFWYSIGASGEYQPAYGDEIIYANSASMAPSIKAINAQTVSHHHRYQTAVPTSAEARKILREKAERARSLLRDYLVGSDVHLRQSFDNIEFFPGTSRALEAGLLRLGNIKRVILSQYEHPSQTDVVTWLSATHGLGSVEHILPDAPSLFEGSWDHQKRTVCDAIRAKLDEDPSLRTAIVLSEVHFVTGLHIQVGEIIGDLRRTHKNVVFVIDGSQSVGNIPHPFIGFAELLERDDFYYFSAHKWLLSPNICGVLVSLIRSDGPHRRPQPYDVFGVELPKTTIDPNTIFGLVSALEVMFGGERRFDLFHDISMHARSLFEEVAVRSQSRFVLVHSSTDALNDSLFLAVRPRLGMKWKYDMAGFWDEMRRRGVDLTVIPEHQPYFAPIAPKDPEKTMNYLLRVSFPYFFVGKYVRALVDHIDDLLVRAN